MKRKIIIRLQNSQIHWIAIDEQGDLINQPSIEMIKPKIAELKRYDCILLVPSYTILLTNVSLPKLSYQQTKKAIPYALEDLLADDIQNLHFALGKKSKDQALPVAVVAKQQMNHWINLMRKLTTDYQLTITTLLPDILALPYQLNRWSILVDNETVLVRSSFTTGFSTSLIQLWDMLHLFLNEIKQKPTHIAFYGFDRIPEAEANFFNALKIEINFYPQSDLLLLLDDVTLEKPPINLLQNPYKLRRSNKQEKQLIKWFGYLFGIFLLVITLGSIAQLIFLETTLVILHKKQQTILNKLSINKTTEEDIKQQMLNQLTKFNYRRNNTFLALLTDISPIFIKLKNNITLLGIDYSDYTLTLELQANSLEDINSLINAMKEKNLTIEKKNIKKINHILHFYLLIFV